MLTTSILSTFVTILLIWYVYYKHYVINYWKKKGVPTHFPKFPAGNITTSILGKENLYILIANIYKELKNKGYKHVGLYFFNGPVYMPIDREIIKLILLKDFEYFTDRGVFLDEENFPLSGHLFALEGLKWKILRAKLTPTFSSGKLKAMYEIFLKTAENFANVVDNISRKKDEINIKFIATNYTTDIILSSAFGIDGNTLENPDDELSKQLLTFFQPSNWIFFKVLLIEGLSKPGNILRAIMSNKNHETFFMNLMKNLIDYRDKNKVTRKDFLSLLLEVRDKQGLTFNEIAAQSFVILFAGSETSAHVISCCIHSLAYNQECQNKLRSEILENLGSNSKTWAYENIINLPYLDNVYNETLRLYPVLGFLNRACVKPYKIPGTEVVLDKGTPVLISSIGLQRDPKYFPEPLKFNPERFNHDQSIIPFTFMPFGEGPRFCIGSRFGQLQSKLGIAVLMTKFRFFPSLETPEQIEIPKFPKTPSMAPANGIVVKVAPIEKN